MLSVEVDSHLVVSIAFEIEQAFFYMHLIGIELAGVYLLNWNLKHCVQLISYQTHIYLQQWCTRLSYCFTDVKVVGDAAQWGLDGGLGAAARLAGMIFYDADDVSQQFTIRHHLRVLVWQRLEINICQIQCSTWIVINEPFTGNWIFFANWRSSSRLHFFKIINLELILFKCCWMYWLENNTKCSSPIFMPIYERKVKAKNITSQILYYMLDHKIFTLKNLLFYSSLDSSNVCPMGRGWGGQRHI